MMNNNTKLIVLTIIWITMVYVWINLENLIYRSVTILIISVITYFIGRLHEQKINTGEKDATRASEYSEPFSNLR